MAATVEDVIAFIGGQDDDLAFVGSCLDVAVALVDNHVGEATNVPENVLDRAAVSVAAELFSQKDSPAGFHQFADAMGNAVGMRANRDPMRPAYALLRPFLPGGFS